MNRTVEVVFISFYPTVNHGEPRSLLCGSPWFTVALCVTRNQLKCLEKSEDLPQAFPLNLPLLRKTDINLFICISTGTHHRNSIQYSSITR